MGKWAKEHPEHTAAYQKKYREEHKEHISSINRTYRVAHWEKEKERAKDRHKRNREAVLTYYGHKCACCGEGRAEFLAVDHINGGGTQQRKTGQYSGYIGDWLVKQNYPDGYRLLCHNCNQALGFYGYCPHQAAP
jgi:hypothetical protein